MGLFLGFLTAVTVLLFLVSLGAFNRSRSLKAGILSAVLCIFSLKNIILSYLYFQDEGPGFTILLFLDVLVVLGVLVGMARK